MVTKNWCLALQSLLLYFFVCQAWKNRVPVQESVTRRYDEYRVVYFATPSSDNATILFAGPARFGVDLRTTDPIESTVEKVEPADGCRDLTNNETLPGKIAIVDRGNCQFAEKAVFIEKTGALAGIVLDYNRGLSSRGGYTFVMGSGSVTENIEIPMVFLYIAEAEVLLNASREYPNLIVGISGKVPTSVPKTKEIVTAIPTTEELVTASHVKENDSGGGDATRLSTLHIALICLGVLCIAIVLAVSLGYMCHSARRKKSTSEDTVQFSRF